MSAGGPYLQQKTDGRAEGGSGRTQDVIGYPSSFPPSSSKCKDSPRLQLVFAGMDDVFKSELSKPDLRTRGGRWKRKE